MVAFASITSVLEVFTAYLVVIFAQMLSQPELGSKYIGGMLGLNIELSPRYLILYSAIILGVVYFIKNLVSTVEVFYQNFSVQKVHYYFKNRLLYHYAEADYGTYLTRNSSFGSAVVSGDVENVFSSGMISLAGILSEGLVFVCVISMVILMNWSLAFYTFGIGALLMMLVSKVLLPKFYNFGQRLQESNLNSGQHLGQFFHAFKEIVLFGKREAFINAYQQHALKKLKIQAIKTAINSLPRMVIEVLFVGLFVFAIVLLCLEHENPYQMIGLLGGYLYAGFRLMPGLSRIISHLTIFKSIIPSIERVYQEYNPGTEKSYYIDIPQLSFKTHIALREVSFQYPNTKKDALHNITIDIKVGECIGLIGETGSGKSTLVDVIIGLLKPYKGAILVDSKYPVNSYQWHQKIGYVPQSVYLTDDTIEANVAFGEKSVDAIKLNAAIDAAQLRKFIDQLPQGVKTIVGERGVRLSGGERQRIAIARALYHGPEVLIFDEATSALDNDTEAKLMETIHAIIKNRTVIMVAHRLTTLRDCNRIIVMEKGQVKEITRYEELLADPVSKTMQFVTQSNS